MKFNFSLETKEAIKEFARVIVLAIIPVVLISLEGSTIDFKVLGFGIVIAVLRATDKYLHEKDSKYQLPF
jgi:hypothetical protein